MPAHGIPDVNHMLRPVNEWLRRKGLSFGPFPLFEHVSEKPLPIPGAPQEMGAFWREALRGDVPASLDRSVLLATIASWRLAETLAKRLAEVAQIIEAIIQGNGGNVQALEAAVFKVARRHFEPAPPDVAG